MRTTLASFGLVLLGSAVAGGQVTCGQTIGKGETAILTADVGPCDTSATIPPPGIGFALMVEGGTLDLGGHTLTCADTDGDGRIPVGIRLDGQNSRVTNGTVVGCDQGFAIGSGAAGEDTRHRVVHVTVRGSSYVGVAVRSNQNTLVDVAATDTLDIPGLGDGFWVLGDENRLVGLVATSNSNFGIRISGRNNEVVGATATGNARDGFWIDDESKRNTLTACRSSGNGDAGIRIEGIKNRITDSIANDNAVYGFVLESGVKNRISGGSARDNATSDLLTCSSDGNKVLDLDYVTQTSVSADCS